MIDTHGRKYFQPVFELLANSFVKLGMSPIKITIIAFVIGLGAIVSTYLSKGITAVILLWLSGLFDVLDGTVARKTGRITDLGAFLDITFDRLIEVGLIVAFAFNNPIHGTMLVVLASNIVIAMTIFLTVGNFAKNHTQKSFYYQAGVAERTEGFIFFTLMILFPGARLIIGYIFSAIIFLTAIQRFVEGIRILKS